MWSETVGLRTRPVWDQKIALGIGLCLGFAHCSLGLVLGLVLFCETRSCHARRHNDLEVRSNLSSTIHSFSILCLEHHYCGDQQWRSLTKLIREVPLFTSGSHELGLGLVILVLVLRISSCLHHCNRLDHSAAQRCLRNSEYNVATSSECW